MAEPLGGVTHTENHRAVDEPGVRPRYVLRGGRWQTVPADDDELVLSAGPLVIADDAVVSPAAVTGVLSDADADEQVAADLAASDPVIDLTDADEQVAADLAAPSGRSRQSKKG